MLIRPDGWQLTPPPHRQRLLGHAAFPQRLRGHRSHLRQVTVRNPIPATFTDAECHEVEKGIHLRGGDVRVKGKVGGAIEQPVRAVAGGGALLQVMRDASVELRR